jgi:transcriptional regulator with XRE-family HTH domain
MTKPTARQRQPSEEERVRSIVVAWFEASGMTQQAVAERVGISQTAVSAFLRGDRFGSLDTLKRFCLCFGHEVGELFAEGKRDATDADGSTFVTRYKALSPRNRKAIDQVLESMMHSRQGRRK